jgi:hypothetical protein
MAGSLSDCRFGPASRILPALLPVAPGSCHQSPANITSRSRTEIAGNTPLQAVLRYRDLLQVEDLFRRAKAILRTRPIYHSSDAAIRGHVFCSFLALMLQKELADLCHGHGLVIEWADLLRDLDRLQEATIEKDGKAITARTAVAGQVGSVFQAAGIALPPNLHERAA